MDLHTWLVYQLLRLVTYFCVYFILYWTFVSASEQVFNPDVWRVINALYIIIISPIDIKCCCIWFIDTSWLIDYVHCCQCLLKHNTLLRSEQYRNDLTSCDWIPRSFTYPTTTVLRSLPTVMVYTSSCKLDHLCSECGHLHCGHIGLCDHLVTHISTQGLSTDFHFGFTTNTGWNWCRSKLVTCLRQATHQICSSYTRPVERCEQRPSLLWFYSVHISALIAPSTWPVPNSGTESNSSPKKHTL